MQPHRIEIATIRVVAVVGTAHPAIAPIIGWSGLVFRENQCHAVLGSRDRMALHPTGPIERKQFETDPPVIG